MKVTKTSQLTGKVHTREIPITDEQYAEYARGSVPLQSAFPWLSANDREFLLTGATPGEWDTLRHPDDPPACNGICLTASDIGLFGSEIAYAHPFCEVHGDGCPGYADGQTDDAGRPMCATCGAYADEHR